MAKRKVHNRTSLPSLNSINKKYLTFLYFNINEKQRQGNRLFSDNPRYTLLINLLTACATSCLILLSK